MGTLRQRINRVNDNVSMDEAYPYITGERIYLYGNRSKQVKCFLHGVDNKPSARIYPDGKLYCYTCRKMYDVVSYCASYKNISYKNYEAMDLLLKELESKFNLFGIPLKIEESSNTSKKWEEVLQPIKRVDKPDITDYRVLFKKKWIELNDRGIALDSGVREKIFEGLELSLKYISGEENYKKAWDFLFKLEKKFI